MNWLRASLPTWLHAPWDFLTSPGMLALLSGLSIALFVASLVGIPWMIARLPEDYFCERADRQSLFQVDSPRRRVFFKVLKNALGALLFVAGLAMLVALALLDIPGKRRFLARIVCRPRIAQTLNRIRQRAGRPPLEFDSE